MLLWFFLRSVSIYENCLYYFLRYDKLPSLKAEAADYRGAAGDQRGGDQEEAGEGGGGKQGSC